MSQQSVSHNQAFAEREYYNTRWEQEGSSASPPNPERVQLVSRLTANLIRKNSCPRILDVGCGNGWILQAISELSPDAVLHGIEPSEAGVANSCRRIPNANISQAMLEDYTTDEVFDIVVCSEVIEHVPEQLVFIRRLAARVRQGGHLIITTPNARYQDTYFKAHQNVVPQPVENWLRPSELIELASKWFTPHDVSTFDLSELLNMSQFMKRARRMARKIPGIYRASTLIDRGLERRGLGLYVIAAFKKSPSYDATIGG